MARLKYVGKAPDSDISVVNKGYIDGQYAAVKVDSDYVASRIATVTPTLVDQAYVDSQDNLRAKKTAVDNADALYVPTSQRGANNGVASIGSDGFIPSAQLPSVLTDRVPFSVKGNISLTGIREVNSTASKTLQAGSLVIPDPGWPYQVLAFVRMQGAATQAVTTPLDGMGTNNYGRILVLGPSDKVMSVCITSGNYRYMWAQTVPYAPLNEQPSTYTGGQTLDLWLSLWSGTTYSYQMAGASFYALIYPAV